MFCLSAVRNVGFRRDVEVKASSSSDNLTCDSAVMVRKPRPSYAKRRTDDSSVISLGLDMKRGNATDTRSCSLCVSHSDHKVLQMKPPR